MSVPDKIPANVYIVISGYEDTEVRGVFVVEEEAEKYAKAVRKTGIWCEVNEHHLDTVYDEGIHG